MGLSETLERILRLLYDLDKLGDLRDVSFYYEPIKNGYWTTTSLNEGWF